jgi:hypothetical protein
VTRLPPNHWFGDSRSDWSFGVADTSGILLMHRAYLFIVTAIGEAGVGLALLVLPSVPLALLFGVIEVAPEASLVARLAGAALLAIGVASWLTRSAGEGSSQVGLLVALLIYDGAATALLGYAGLVLSMAGIALWPAVVLHTVLSIWTSLCLFAEPHGASAGGHSDLGREP